MVNDKEETGRKIQAALERVAEEEGNEIVRYMNGKFRSGGLLPSEETARSLRSGFFSSYTLKADLLNNAGAYLAEEFEVGYMPIDGSTEFLKYWAKYEEFCKKEVREND